MKDAIIYWDKNVFDGEKKSLPDKNKLYTQIIVNNNTAWSLVLHFENSPGQGYTSKSKVHFLMDNAPNELLKTGFRFNVMDGGKKIGEGEVIE